jgi:WhiB family redox-sensing transcriptional regulator
MSWRDRAACTGRSDIDWFPAPDLPIGERQRRTQQALAVCDGCSVRPQCLATALEDPHTVGVWGGTTEHERRGKWQRPLVIRCGTDSGYSRHIRAGETACTACREAHAHAGMVRRLRLVTR